jgi:hypothetical protein
MSKLKRKPCYFLNQSIDSQIFTNYSPIELEIIQIDHFAFLNFNQTLLFCQNLFLPYQFAIFLFYFVCSLNNLSNFSLSRSSNNHHPIIGFRVNKTPFQNKIRCGGIAGSTEKCWFSSPMRSS